MVFGEGSFYFVLTEFVLDKSMSYQYWYDSKVSTAEQNQYWFDSKVSTAEQNQYWYDSKVSTAEQNQYWYDSKVPAILSIMK